MRIGGGEGLLEVLGEPVDQLEDERFEQRVCRRVHVRRQRDHCRKDLLVNLVELLRECVRVYYNTIE